MQVLRKLELIMTLLLVAVFATAGCSSSTQAGSNPNGSNKPGILARLFETTQPITVPEGTMLGVVLSQSISTAGNRSGDSFEATVASPVMIGGKTVIPKDAVVKGHIVDAEPSGRLKGVAHLGLTIDTVEVNGQSYEIATDEWGRRGKNHNKRNGILIGGGAGFGAVVGGLAGGPLGAVIGSSAGAGAGTAGAAYTGKKDIKLPAETALSFRLERAVTIPVKS
jgi:hypothetical protein